MSALTPEVEAAIRERWGWASVEADTVVTPELVNALASVADAPALLAALDAERAKVAWYEERFPCDSLCSDAPEEDCSRHGRTPADLWSQLSEVATERDAERAKVASLRHGRKPAGLWSQLSGVVVEALDAERAKVAAIRAALTDVPTCDKYDDDGPITCGWKRAVESVRAVLTEADDE